VVTKLVITGVATFVLVLYTQTLAALADVAISSGDAAALRSASPLVHVALALVVLLGATVLSVFKPKGLTVWGWRRQQRARAA
jgi:hypothetical protein